MAPPVEIVDIMPAFLPAVAVVPSKSKLPDHKYYGVLPEFYTQVTITEMIDGKSGVLYVDKIKGIVTAGTRWTWLDTPHWDGYGFQTWARVNEKALLNLGPGYHFGVWWGHDIERGYNLNQKRFSLLDNIMWDDLTKVPDCCGVVPELYRGPMTDTCIPDTLRVLKEVGSLAAHGYKRPMGIVIRHLTGNVKYKVIIN